MGEREGVNVPMEPRLVRRAVEIYLSLAYVTSSPPAAVRKRVDALACLVDEAFFDAAPLERCGVGTGPTRYSLRLGSASYPHMKLAVESSPDGRGYLLRVDTHDRHVCPPVASKEYPAFCELMGRNQAVAQAIEAEWARAGLPTFKGYLREDLARRKAGVAQPPPP